MIITKHRFFGAFLDTQENWLNKMARQGYRLVKTSKTSYDFEMGEPDTVEYKMEFIADKSRDDKGEYRKRLEDKGYKVFAKNINLQHSFSELRLRRRGKKKEPTAKKRTTFDRELFIVEKARDGKAFEMYTTSADRANYYTSLRNAWLCPTAVFGILAAVYIPFAISSALAFLALAIASAIPFISYQKMITRYKNSTEKK